MNGANDPYRAADNGPDAGLPVRLVRRYSKIETYLFLIAMLGYPMIALVSSVLAPSSSTMAIVMRTAVCAMSLVPLWGFLTSPRRDGFRFLDPAIGILILIYSVRLLADALSGAFPDLWLDALQFYGFCVIPLMGLSVWVEYRRPHRDTELFFMVGGVLCVGYLAATLLGFGGTAEATSDFNGRLALGRLNPISLGQLAVTTVLAAAALFFEKGHRGRLRAFILPVVLVAGGCIVLAASRGPVIGLVGGLIGLLIFQKRWKLLALVVALSVYWGVQVTNSENQLIDRLLAIGSDRTSLERFELQSLAFGEFQDHPFLGSAYVEIITGRYPHNIVLDAAMSLGIVGLVLMIAIIVRSGFAVARRMAEGELLLPLLTIQYILATQFSGAMYNSLEFWICCGLILLGPRRRPGHAQSETALSSA